MLIGIVANVLIIWLTYQLKINGIIESNDGQAGIGYGLFTFFRLIILLVCLLFVVFQIFIELFKSRFNSKISKINVVLFVTAIIIYFSFSF